MTTEPYVPNLATVESAYVHWALMSDRGIDAADASDEFDGFIAKVKADALREAALMFSSRPGNSYSGVAVTLLLDARADRIEGEA